MTFRQALDADADYLPQAVGMPVAPVPYTGGLDFRGLIGHRPDHCLALELAITPRKSAMSGALGGLYTRSQR